MLKEIKNLIFIFIICLFLFLTGRYYFSDMNKKNSNRSFGSIEEKRDDIDVVSPGSPLGEALLGGKAGDIVSFEAPHGALKVEIVSIEN